MRWATDERTYLHDVQVRGQAYLVGHVARLARVSKMRLGSTAPDRVAPGRPWRGVRPMEVSREVEGAALLDRVR